jgi:hypothetical protein
MPTDTIKWIEIYYKILNTIYCQQINYWVYRGPPSPSHRSCWSYPGSSSWREVYKNMNVIVKDTPKNDKYNQKGTLHSPD